MLILINSSLPQATADLSSALLSSSLTGHKIRHIEEKLSMLDEDSQLVAAVLDIFCTKKETVMYVMCMEKGQDGGKILGWNLLLKCSQYNRDAEHN